MAFRRRRRRDTRVKRWTGDQNAAAGTALGAGVLGFLQIVAPTDYEQSATMEQGGVTLARIRGSGTVIGSIANLDVVMACYVAEKIVTPTATLSLDPSVFTELIRGDLLWMRRLLTGTAGDAQHFDFDIRAKRKLRDHQVVFVIRNIGGAGTATLVVSARALLLGG